MVTAAHPDRKIAVKTVETHELWSEHTELLQGVGYSTPEELFQHIENGNYSEHERIVAERLEAIHWLLGPDE